MNAENRGQRVRGVVAVGFSRCACYCTDPAKMEEQGGVVAYTPWHRHDEDLTIVEKELDQLVKLYSSFSRCEGCMYHFEYKDYMR